MTAPASAGQALAIGQRLLSPGAVLDAVPSAQAGASLADGLSGTALLHARLAAADPRFEDAAICHWAAAGRLCAEGPAAGGIYSGPGGLAASLIIGSGYLRDPDRCRAAASRGVRWASARARAIAGWQNGRLARHENGTPWPVYDVISGLAGLGRVLLAADAAGFGEAGPGLAAARDALTRMILAGDGSRPGWWQPAAGAAGHDGDVAATGVAHGIAGPLAFLAVCQRAGYGDAAQLAAIRQAAGWLLSWRHQDSWPAQVTSADLQRGFPARNDDGRRDAWCYGAPGIGRALAAAGHALGSREITAAGQAALAAQGRRDARTWDTDGPGLCHGHAGVLQCAAGSPQLQAAAARAVAAAFSPRARFGFRNGQGSRQPRRPGLLTGAAGVALALADHARLPGPAAPTSWDAVLLLS